jgi:hypothetical protein
LPDCEVEELLPKISIGFCLLDIYEKERAVRLQKRKMSQELIDDTEELFGLRKWVPESDFVSVSINVTNKTVEQTAKSVINWYFTT